MTWPTFKTHDEIPESFRGEYHEVNGQWVPKVADGPTEADVAAVKEAARKERELHAAAEKRAKEAEAQLKALEMKKKAEDAGLTSERLAEIEAQARTAAETKFADYETLRAENRGLKLDSQVKKIALEAGVRGDRVDAWWKQFGDRFDLTTDGKPVIKAKPTDDLKGFITGELKQAFPELYVGTKAAGSGSGGMLPIKTGGMSYEDFQKLSPSEKMRVAREAEQPA